MNTRSATRAYVAVVLAIVGVLGLHLAGQRAIDKGWNPFDIGGYVITAVLALYNTAALDEPSDKSARVGAVDVSEWMAACPPGTDARETEDETTFLGPTPRANDTLGS